jgi:hypothetical protein
MYKGKDLLLGIWSSLSIRKGRELKKLNSPKVNYPMKK